MMPALRPNILGHYAGRMAYTYTEMFVSSRLQRQDAKSSAGGTIREPAVAGAKSKDDVRKHIEEMDGQGWKMEQYVVTAREDGFRHHMVWYKAGAQPRRSGVYPTSKPPSVPRRKP